MPDAGRSMSLLVTAENRLSFSISYNGARHFLELTRGEWRLDGKRISAGMRKWCDVLSAALRRIEIEEMRDA